MLYMVTWIPSLYPQCSHIYHTWILWEWYWWEKWFQNYVFTNVSFHHPMVSKTSVCVFFPRFYGDGENGIGFSKPSLLDFWLFWWNIWLELSRPKTGTFDPEHRRVTSNLLMKSTENPPATPSSLLQPWHTKSWSMGKGEHAKMPV